MNNDLEKKSKDLTNTLRLTQNIINLLMEARFPGQYYQVLGESLNWLQVVSKDLETQLTVIKSIDKIEEKTDAVSKAQAVEVEVVK